MQYGFILPGSEPRLCAELAAIAEESGWDGVFVPDGISIETATIPPMPMFDPWVTLAAMAMRTERVRLGTMLTAVPRRRPWKLARELFTLDHLSGGRVIFAAGVGAAKDDAGFWRTGEPMELKVRAEMLDEGLAIIDGLSQGEAFSFAGEHFRVDELTLVPGPGQQPRIPTWVVGVWPSEKSMARAVRYDGIIPQRGGSPGPLEAEEIAAIAAFATERRAPGVPFEVIAEGETDIATGEGMSRVAELAAAGATWWLESRWMTDGDWEPVVRARLRQGPMRVG